MPFTSLASLPNKDSLSAYDKVHTFYIREAVPVYHPRYFQGGTEKSMTFSSERWTELSLHKLMGELLIQLILMASHTMNII